MYDKKSKEEEFTGISSGEKKYVLDLQTKDELNKNLADECHCGIWKQSKEGFRRAGELF